MHHCTMLPHSTRPAVAVLVAALVGAAGCTLGEVDQGDRMSDAGSPGESGTDGRGDAGGTATEDTGTVLDAGTDAGADAGDEGGSREPVSFEVEDLPATPRTRFSSDGADHGGRGWLAFDRGGYAEGVVGAADGILAGPHRLAVRARGGGRARLHVDRWFTVFEAPGGDVWALVEIPVTVPGDPVILRVVRLDGDLQVDRLTLTPGGPGARPIPACWLADVERNPGAGWADSYAADGQCYCASTFDHNVGQLLVPTPAGPRTVREVCAALGPGPGKEGRPLFNDVQCGHGPANDAGDEDWCPGRTDQGRDGCCDRGPRWDLTDADL